MYIYACNVRCQCTEPFIRIRVVCYYQNGRPRCVGSIKIKFNYFRSIIIIILCACYRNQSFRYNKIAILIRIFDTSYTRRTTMNDCVWCAALNALLSNNSISIFKRVVVSKQNNGHVFKYC